MIDLAKIKELLAETACPGDLVPPAASEADLNSFELRASVRLPGDLRSWYLLTDGPNFTNVGFPSIRRSADQVSRLETWLDFVPTWRVKGWLPVANDGCGNYYLLANEGDFGPGRPVFFVDMIADRNWPTYIVASCMATFLVFVLQSNMGLWNWPFDKEFVVSEDPAILRFQGLPFPWEKTKGTQLDFPDR